jgi:protein O-mannosyl-transferase
MSKKNKNKKHIHQAPNTQSSVDTPWWIIPFILVLTLIAYLPAFNAGFVNWDDGKYVFENLMIQDLSNIKAFFTTPVEGNYHPLTMISLAVNYAMSDYEPWSYHLFNILFHLINCYLVFVLAMRLSNNKLIVAFTTALLFGIHPMHVESVAWVSERKDVLYGIFFIAGLITYDKYLEKKSGKLYGLTVLFLVLSLLSKPAAVIFPVALLSIDFLRSRPLKFNLIIEKIPFFAMALITGILTYMAQKEAGATDNDVLAFGIGAKILFGFYGFMMYIVKMFIPINLSPFYPFPSINVTLPSEYFFAPLFFAAVAVLFYYSLKKGREFGFGLLFYLINLLLVLQVVSVGSAVMAERYTYIPYIGLFFSIGILLERFFSKNKSAAYYLIIPVSFLFTFLSYSQAAVWTSSETLWDHTIEVLPSARAYNNRALLLRKEKKFEQAIEYYTKAIAINAVDHEAYCNRANNYLDMNNMDQAYKDYKKSISLKSDYHPVLDNMGVWFAIKGNYDSALYYFTKSINAKPDYKPPYSNRALTYMNLNRHVEALKDLNTFLVLDPKNPDMLNLKGACLREMNRFEDALAPINQAIILSPNPAFYLNRSYTYKGLGDINNARQDALKSKQAGHSIPLSYLQSLGIQ